MIIRILKPNGKWKVGDTPDVTTSLAAALCATGVAQVDADQTRRDFTPKPPAEEPQPMVVNNYFVTPEEVYEIEEEAVISNLKKK